METSTNDAVKRLRKRSITYGFMVDVVCSVLTGVVIMLALAKVGLDESVLQGTFWYDLYTTIAALGWTVVGGAFAAWHSGYRYAAHGMWVGIVGVVLAIPMLILAIVVDAQAVGLVLNAFDAIQIAFAVPAGYLGGMLIEHFLMGTPAPTPEHLPAPESLS